MPYRPLAVPPDTPSDAQEFVRERVDPFLRDVHAMLGLPRDDVPGLEGGCNLSAALVLLGVVSGVSVSLYYDPDLEGVNERERSGRAFKRLLETHYPWDDERALEGAICGKHAAEVLYDAFRNPLTHSLGVDAETGHGQRKVAKGPLPNEEVERIEASMTRPADWRGPTLRTDSRVKVDRTSTVLTVKVFYWGVRRMIWNLLEARIGHPDHRSMPKLLNGGVDMTATGTFTHSTPATYVSSGPNDPDTD